MKEKQETIVHISMYSLGAAIISLIVVFALSLGIQSAFAQNADTSFEGSFASEVIFNNASGDTNDILGAPDGLYLSLTDGVTLRFNTSTQSFDYEESIPEETDLIVILQGTSTTENDLNIGFGYGTTTDEDGGGIADILSGNASFIGSTQATTSSWLLEGDSGTILFYDLEGAEEFNGTQEDFFVTVGGALSIDALQVRMIESGEDNGEDNTEDKHLIVGGGSSIVYNSSRDDDDDRRPQRDDEEDESEDEEEDINGVGGIGGDTTPDDFSSLLEVLQYLNEQLARIISSVGTGGIGGDESPFNELINILEIGNQGLSPHIPDIYGNM